MKLADLNRRSTAKVTEQKAKIKYFQKELATVQMERAILKKAAAYFAKQSLQSTRS